MKKTKVLFVLLIISILLSACQPTPSDNVVVGKDGLEAGINKTATAAPTQNEENNSGSSWTYEKEYASGRKLIVDAKLPDGVSNAVPVLSIGENKFESGEQLKSIVNVFCSGEKVYDAGEVTKSTYEKALMNLREKLFRLDNDLPLYPEDPDAKPVPAQYKDQERQQLNAAIEDNEDKLKTAPSDDSLQPASFILINAGNSYQSNMVSKYDGATVDFDFVNWALGSSFYLNSVNYESDHSIKLEKLISPDLLDSDSSYLKVKELAEKCVKDMGIDYMSINSVAVGSNGYKIYFTRSYNNLQETYVGNFLGTTVTGVDNAAVIDLWKSEYLCFEMQNGKIVKVSWINPSKILKVDNDNVQVKTWDEIQKIFYTQMEYLLTPNLPQDKGMGIQEVHINRVEFGFAKVLMKNSKNDYKLVPTWSFMGNDQDTIKEGNSQGSSTCFLTINAIDGSVIDRGLMY